MPLQKNPVTTDSGKTKKVKNQENLQTSNTILTIKSRMFLTFDVQITKKES